MGSPFGRPLPDVRRAPTGVATGYQSGRSGDRGRDGGGGRDVGFRVEGESNQVRYSGHMEGKVSYQLVEGDGASSTSVMRRVHCRGAVLTGGVPDIEGGGGYRGIVLVEVILKAMAMIINSRFAAAITYHNFLHRFRASRVTETATLDFKLIQQVAVLRKAVLHAIFLDLHKAYNALYRSRCLGILEGYDVGPRALRLLQQYWARLNMVAWSVGYYGSPFRGEKGVTQGSPLSPTIFNVVVDAVVFHWESLLVAEREGVESRGN